MIDKSTEMTISEYDMAVFHESKAEATRKHQRSIQRMKSTAAATGWIALAAAVISVAYIVWLAVRGPSANAIIEQEARSECVAAGGTWLKLYTGADSAGDGTCVIGKPVDELN